MSDGISEGNTLAKPVEIEWSHEDALAFKGHGLDRAHMREWAEHYGWDGLPDDIDEVRVVKTPDRTGEYDTRWHQSTSPRATAYTIAWCRPRSAEKCVSTV